MIEVELISIGIDWDWWMPVCVGYVVMYVWMFECIYESSNECVSELMNECVNIWKNVWINEWDMNDEWMHCTHICTTPTYNIHLYVMYLLYWRLVLFVICIVCFFRAFIYRINTPYPTWLFWCLCWLHAWCEPAKLAPNEGHNCSKTLIPLTVKVRYHSINERIIKDEIYLRITKTTQTGQYRI